jgi:hypothetical protein
MQTDRDKIDRYINAMARHGQITLTDPDTTIGNQKSSPHHEEFVREVLTQLRLRMPTKQFEHWHEDNEQVIRMIGFNVLNEKFILKEGFSLRYISFPAGSDQSLYTKGDMKIFFTARNNWCLITRFDENRRGDVTRFCGVLQTIDQLRYVLKLINQ